MSRGAKMPLWIQISPGSKDPIYTQIYEQISRAVLTGVLAVGDKLPPVRRLAAELVVNPNTVAKAYTQLEQAGLVGTRTGSGTFVLDPEIQSPDAVQLNLLTERLDSVISQARVLGLSREEFDRLCRKHTDRLYHNLQKGSE